MQFFHAEPEKLDVETKHMPLLRARAVHAMTQEVLFLFHLQRNALQVSLLEIILSKD